MKKSIGFILLLCLFSTLWNCSPLMDWIGEDSEEEVDEPQEFNPEKGKYYLFENEYPSDYEWDWQIFKDDTLISVKDDTLRKQFIWRTGMAYDKDDCIIFRCTYDGKLIQFGDLDTLYNVTYYDNHISLWYIDRTNQIITKQIPFTKFNTNESRSLLNIGEETVIKIMKWGNSILDTHDGAQMAITSINRERYPLHKAAIDLSQMAIATGVGSLIGGPVGATAGFVTSAGFMYVNNKMQANNEEINSLFYGDHVDICIDSVQEHNDGTLTVSITLSNINSIPTNIPFKDKEGIINEGYNYINIGVLAKENSLPYTDDFDVCALEVPININAANIQNFKLTIPSLKGGEYLIRPYIQSMHEILVNDKYLNFISNIDGDFVKYGQHISQYIKSLYITNINPKKLVYDYTSQKLLCSYSVEVEKNIGNIPGNKIVSGYGIYEYDVYGNKKIHPLVNEGSNTKGYVQISENPMGVEYDYKNYTGSIEKRFGTYIATINDSYFAVQDTIFFYENNYTLTFQMEKPSIDIKSIKLIEKKDVQSSDNMNHHLGAYIHGYRCEYEIKVTCKTRPFGYTDAFLGGVLYELRGGTPDYPTPAYIEIQSIVWNNTPYVVENGTDYTFRVYVLRHDNEKGIGKNPLYIGFKSKFTETDSIVCNECIKFNYVGTPYLDFEGAYSKAEISTEKVPELKRDTIYSQGK